jgi:hypothetical protein
MSAVRAMHRAAPQVVEVLAKALSRHQRHRALAPSA